MHIWEMGLDISCILRYFARENRFSPKRNMERNVEKKWVLAINGSDGSGATHPRWMENLKLAVAVQEQVLSEYPTLMRPLLLRKSRYNQHATTGSIRRRRCWPPGSLQSRWWWSCRAGANERVSDRVSFSCVTMCWTTDPGRGDANPRFPDGRSPFQGLKEPLSRRKKMPSHVKSPLPFPAEGFFGLSRSASCSCVRPPTSCAA